MIDGKTDKYYPLEQQRGWLSLTGIISALLILATIGIVASIYYMRFVLYQQNFSQAQVVASVVNAVQVICWYRSEISHI